MELFTWSIPNSIVKWTSWCVKSVPRIPSHAPIFCERRILNCWISFHFFNGKVRPFASTEELLNISRECYWAMSSNHIASHSRALSYKSGALLKKNSFLTGEPSAIDCTAALFCVKRHTTTGWWKNSATCWLGRPLCGSLHINLYLFAATYYMLQGFGEMSYWCQKWFWDMGV